MTINRYAKKRDANEPEIIKALKALGCTVMQSDVVDLIVGRSGRTFLLEVKTAKGKLEPSQEAILATWRGHYAIVRTVDEAINAVSIKIEV